ncbi:LysR family transcriptional regulator [Lactobacillus sp. PFC-70]|uniref:LysR family transcriptional regulator n=1 Tax=Levilactobacillus namurensis TaxID=380393 RepID=UPI000D31F12E|nr:LysR family transcriptional regulator [Levilactobacillus namurensis]MCW3779151.1 LysR family transcriptional regulator [Levilactobacillus namurensis]MDT7017720.1 LysR family transcriptional regulator [Levilactobacillus namurensis]PTM22747.1 LysR family transcriptional regulator [Lactobacillus sp. PFC-70]WNN65278.1 LysR family transcriptional regulator [Levilactobacillus namurensis]
MNFRQLEYFLAVADAGQITAAAQQLHMAQPPLSYQLKQLEAELGVTLLHRTSSGTSLTPAGVLLRDYAQQLLDLRERADSQVRSLGQGLAGVLSVGVISSSIGAMPNAKLRTLTRHYPKVQIRLFEDNTYGLIDRLEKHLIDVAIVRTPFTAPRLASKDLKTESMVAVVPKKYDHFRGATLRVEDLADVPLIIYRRFEHLFAATFAQKGMAPFVACTCDDARTAVQWAEARMGVAVVPQSVAEQISGPQTNLRPIRYQPWRTTLKLVWPEQVTPGPLLQRFIDSY